MQRMARIANPTQEMLRRTGGRGIEDFTGRDLAGKEFPEFHGRFCRPANIRPRLRCDRGVSLEYKTP
jgi:hypothetical protein